MITILDELFNFFIYQMFGSPELFGLGLVGFLSVFLLFAGLDFGIIFVLMFPLIMIMTASVVTLVWVKALVVLCFALIYGFVLISLYR